MTQSLRVKRAGSSAPSPAEAGPLFGDEPYPSTGPLAVLARLGLVVCGMGLIYAAVTPGPSARVLYSNNLEHFAAFYVVALTAAAAFPRRRLRWLSLALALTAAGLELCGVFERPLLLMVEQWCADFGGVMAAFAPMMIEQFRRLFPRDAR